MKITDVRSLVLSIPLREATAFATTVVSAREYVIVTIDTDEGIEGTGFAVGTRHPGEGHLIGTAVQRSLKDLLVGETPFAVERLWERMYQHTLLVGRRGAVLRAISALDIALWDIAGKAAERPLYQLLGGHRDAVPCYASGGYYREGKGLDGLAAEMGRYLAAGFTSVKMKVGRLDAREDAERVRVARETIGPGVQLALDANNAWPDAPTAIRAVRMVEEYDPWWIEEPVMPDNVPASAAVAAALDLPVATGEHEATRWGFRDLLDRKAADIVQPDATVCGGVTEWIRIAHMAAGWDVPVAPHWFANLHVHLVAAVPNGLTVEFFVLEEDVFNFERVVRDPLRPAGGMLEVPQRPGHGIVLDGDG
ncbi:MAG: mandelate racemase/muconate lactonizing enzyme family protein, partial [Actinomycetota bacterium]